MCQEDTRSKHSAQHALISYTEHSKDVSTRKHKPHALHLTSAGRDEASFFFRRQQIDHDHKKNPSCNIGRRHQGVVTHLQDTFNKMSAHAASLTNSSPHEKWRQTHNALSPYTNSQHNHRTVSHDSRDVSNVQKWPVDQLGTWCGSQTTTNTTCSRTPPRFVCGPSNAFNINNNNKLSDSVSITPLLSHL